MFIDLLIWAYAFKRNSIIGNMKKGRAVLFGVVLLAIIGAIFYLNKPDTFEIDDTASGESESSRAVLAENNGAAYKEFNQADYEKAISENRKILLYFYASWCPICRAEQPEVISAFNELNNVGIVGFRVNYKDSDTDSYESNLAEEFGISYQHTKVILVNGDVVLKSLESWNKDKYLEELNKL